MVIQEINSLCSLSISLRGIKRIRAFRINEDDVELILFAAGKKKDEGIPLFGLFGPYGHCLVTQKSHHGQPAQP